MIDKTQDCAICTYSYTIAKSGCRICYSTEKGGKVKKHPSSYRKIPKPQNCGWCYNGHLFSYPNIEHEGHCNLHDFTFCDDHICDDFIEWEAGLKIAKLKGEISE